MHGFEVKLQDAYETLYGTRDIGVPYFDPFKMYMDGDTTTDLFTGDVYWQANALGTAENIQSMFGSRPAKSDQKARNIYDKGFTMINITTSGFWDHSSWSSTQTSLESLFDESLKWDKRMKAIETLHNGPHLATGDPMKPLVTAANHIIFWLHHSNIDRQFESLLQMREDEDGSRSVFEAEMAATTGKKGVWDTPLSPFVHADGSDWTCNGTHTTVPFHYQYDNLMTAADYLSSKAYEKKVARRTVHSGGTSTTKAEISYGRGVYNDPCTLTDEQESFSMHFFLQPKAGCAALFAAGQRSCAVSVHVLA